MEILNKKLTVASLKMFIRNKQAFFFTLFTPLLIMVVFSLIGFDRPPKYDVGLVVGNPQPLTRQFVDQVKGFSVFTIHEGTLDEELGQLKSDNRVAVLDIPDNFISTAVPTQPNTLQVYINESEQSQAQTVVSVLSQFLDKTSLSLVRAPTFFNISQEVVSSHHLTYVDFLLPGLVALSIMQMSVFSVAFVFAQYKEKGVLKRLLATPMKPFQFVSANVITRLIVAVVQTFIFILVGVLLLHAHVVGSYLLVFLCVILGGLMFLGLGFTVSGLSKSVESVPAIANLIVFPMLFLGGTFFPFSSMPDWLQKFAKLLPLSYFSTALRDVMTQNAGLGAIKWDLLAMIIWGAVLITIAVITFRFQEKDSG